MAGVGRGLRGLGLVVGLPAWTLAAELTVVQSGPQGEVGKLEEAREIRIVFSEPMVVLGRIPGPVTAPFFGIRPKLSGSFRWSGTHTLLFTPKEPLPHATRYEVTIDTTATSVAGNRLAAPHTFSFATPTLRLTQARWYRTGRRHDGSVVIGLRFNQPVEARAVAKHTSLQYWSHQWEPPLAPEDVAGQLAAADPRALADFEAKVARVKADAGRTGVVRYKNASDWDTATFRPGDDLVVLETTDVPPPDTWLRVRIGPKVLGVQGTQAPGKPQETRLELEPAFFVEGLRCTKACDPDTYNPLRLRAAVEAGAARKAVRVTDLTDPAQPTRLGQAARSGEGEDALYDYEYDHGSSLALEDAGFSLQPARTYAVIVDKDLTAEDGQVLGYTWGGSLENWHRRSFTSFGSGHGVWETGGGRQLPFYARNLRSASYWLAPITPQELMPTIQKLEGGSFSLFPEGPGTLLSLRLRADRIESRAVDLEGMLGPGGTGLVWAGLEDGETIPKAHPTPDRNRRATLVQVTNLGINIKDSPLNTLVFVTRLDTGEPVAAADVEIRTLDNKVFRCAAPRPNQPHPISGSTSTARCR